MHKNGKVVSWYYCQQLGLPRPANKTICDVDVPVDCVTSLWSSWSFANSSSLQYRYREILLPPMFGGQKCPHTYENKLCSNCSMNYKNYQWQIGYWGACKPLLGPSNYGHGIRYRNVTCINKYGHTVNNNACSAIFKPHNLAFETCEVPCNCTVSEWSSWSECEQNHYTLTYQQIRTRIIVKYPTHLSIHHTKCPTLNETRLCREDLISCNFTYEVSGWSACNLYDDSINCGAGIRTRFLYCKKTCGNYTSYANLLECKVHLNSPPTTHESCFSFCDQDCHLGQWSEWSYCTPFQSCNGENPGYRFRERSVVVPQLQSGNPCLHTIEIRNCIPDHCMHPRWHIRNFSSCHLTSNLTCGSGVITRDIDCIDYHNAKVSADECLIGQDEKPSETVPCQVPCSDDCVLSEWSVWSPCSRTCSGGTRKRNRHILAYGLINCSSTELQEVETCNKEINCTSYKVYYGEWSECNSVVLLNVSTSYCNNGTQTRTATCKFVNTTVTCPGYFGRDTSRQCTVCRNNCIKSEWYYTSCSTTCGNDGYRLKYRIVLWQGENGACSNVDEDGREVIHEMCPTMPSCQNYMWVTSEWSKCYLPIGENCGIGYKNRSIYCTNSSDHKFEDFYCMHNYDHLKKHVTFKNCIIPCHDQCILKTWSKFGPCSKSCSDSPGIRTRVRHVTLPLGAEGSIAKNCPELNTENLVEEQQCDVPECMHHKWITSSWSSCSADKSCGAGVQVRTITCIKITANTTVFVNSSLCEQSPSPPVHVKNCIIECPTDCTVSDWKNWGPCSAECGIGTTTRHRTILQASNVLGRPCPALQEVKICIQRPCGEFMPSEWSTCVISNANNSIEYCGNGTRSQNYSCYVDGHVSDDIFCNGTIPVTKFQDCFLPCSGDCVLSDWSEDLTNCSDCVDSSCNKMLTRKIWRQPLPSGKQCGSLIKTEFCSASSNYYWHTGPWLSCMLFNESHLCGNGFHTREVKCIRRPDNQMVPDYHCAKIMSKPLHEEPCDIKCPVDCIVAAFEPWSVCNASCNMNNIQTRYRNIILYPNEYGRPCPHLNETRHCKVEINNCYTYHLSNSQWSSCKLNTNGNYCGNLTKHRNVDCKRNDGAFVGYEKCADQNSNVSLYTEAPCTVECKPDKCHYNEWSSWSSCTALETKNITRFQFRSRYLLNFEPNNNLYEEDCLSDQYETKKCDDHNDTYLLSFKWKFSPWLSQGSRDVWCESSNKTSVSELACTAALKPSNTLCVGGCIGVFHCNHISGYCQCHAGLVFTSGQCLPIQGCLINAHCLLENTECTNLTCVCSQGYHMDDGKCIKDIRPTSAIASPTSFSSSNTEISSGKFKLLRCSQKESMNSLL